MKRLITSWAATALALLLVPAVVPGVRFDTWTAAAKAALVIVLLNTFIKPLLIIITLPITILSLGLFTLVINALLFLAASRLIAGFTVAGFWSAFWGALLLSVLSLFINRLTGSPATVHVRRSTVPPRPAGGRVIDVETVPDDNARKPEQLDRRHD